MERSEASDSEYDTDSEGDGKKQVTFFASNGNGNGLFVRGGDRIRLAKFKADSAIDDLLKLTAGVDPMTLLYMIIDALALDDAAADPRTFRVLTKLLLTAANARGDQAEHKIDAEKLQKSRRLELAQKRAKLKAIGAKIGDARAAGKTPNPRTVKSQGILKARVEQLIGMLGANTSSPEAGPA